MAARMPPAQCTHTSPAETSSRRRCRAWTGMWTEPSMYPCALLGATPDVEHDDALRLVPTREVGECRTAGGSRCINLRHPAAGSPVAAAAGWSMPTRTSSRWAAASCSGARRASAPTGLPQGISQAR